MRIDSCKLQILGVKLGRRGREEGELHRDTVAAKGTRRKGGGEDAEGGAGKGCDGVAANGTKGREGRRGTQARLLLFTYII